MVARPCLGCQRVTTAGSYCPSCRAGLVAKRNARRPTTVQQGMTRQYRNNREKVIKASPFCALCGSTDQLTADHIIPRSKGGDNGLDNLRTLCHRCNSARGNR